MKSKILVMMLALSLLGAWSTPSAAQILGYNLDKSERGFKQAPDAEPSSAAVAFDGLIGRPVGLITTGIGTTLFILNLPFSVPSGSTREAARGMIGKPGGWTFVRPMGRSDPRFEEKGIFGR